jgi:hypothetical protein
MSDGGRGKVHPSECDHKGTPIVIKQINDGVVAECLRCGETGPEREDSQEAKKALQEG